MLTEKLYSLCGQAYDHVNTFCVICIIAVDPLDPSCVKKSLLCVCQCVCVPMCILV